MRRLVAISIAFLAVGLAGGAQGGGQATSPFVGSWQTTRGPMTLRAFSDVVDWGEYGDEGLGRVCGVHVFNVDQAGKQTLTLAGLWYEGGPVYQPKTSIECGDRRAVPWGWFYFTISADGRSFTGGFKRPNDGLPLGNHTHWNTWDGTKVGSGSPPPPGPPPPPPPAPQAPSGAQRFEVSVTGTGTFNPGDAPKNVFSIGASTYRLTKPRIALTAAIRHNTTVVESPVKLLSGNVVVTVVFRRIRGTGSLTVPYELDYRVVKADDFDDSAKGQAFDFTGKLTKPNLSICKTLDVYSDPDGYLFDFTICGVEGTGRATTRYTAKP